ALTTASPAPRGLAYLGLEHPSGTRLDALAHLASRGIFRKYERVVIPEGELGGAARWLVTRLGCEAITTAADPGVARACAMLTERTPARGPMSSLAAQPHALPFAAARFTHAWLLEPCFAAAELSRALAELRRVRRRGGYLAVQALGPPDRAAAAAPFDSAGFVEIDVRDVTGEALEQTPAVLTARARLLEEAQSEPPSSPLRAFVEAREARRGALNAGTLRVLQLAARRP